MAVSGHLFYEHTLNYFFNSENLSESHYYGNHFFLPRSLPKFLTRLPFIQVIVLAVLLVTCSVFQIHTSLFIEVICQNCLR